MIEWNKKTIFLMVAMPTTALLLYWLIKSSRDGKNNGPDQRSTPHPLYNIIC